MKLLITGYKGQVVSALKQMEHQLNSLEFVCIGRPQFDLAKPEKLDEIVDYHNPDLIVNAAAWTAVDAAETERDTAFAVNHSGAEYVAMVANRYQKPIVQISTDYVFSGEKSTAYLETDRPDPQSVYGASKLAGEEAVKLNNPRHFILRTSWVYSATGSNFLKTMLRVAAERESLNVVADQYGAPTHADEIARGILGISEAILDNPDETKYGTYHLTCQGRASWYDFAEEIFRASESLNGPVARVSKIPASDYPTPAKRPANSCLNGDKLEQNFGIRLSHWKDPVFETVKRVLEASA